VKQAEEVAGRLPVLGAIKAATPLQPLAISSLLASCARLRATQ